ncbi:MAG: AAA family ATPase [Elusimicrobia bacterium]|nr:AAA family ATPase [Elusimicrobiota bacterium]
MYLKSIDIVGYKSFAPKTHLDLQPGITGIIGPNGCGKSNIMEAVRWCLGEMSWKSLRADSMVEVIFAGTAKRQPLSMAEVLLTFDNTASLLPVQFNEVTVARRIFRSGESAYFLNKTQCRLRDIREMFLDTGLGGDGYAIIDQGGVDAMITAKPEERRAFFEEAAGVAKYKAKREEALRKLERVEMDMGRLQDSVTLINEQVKKLDSDARKAKLFQKYKEELNAVEAAHILKQVCAIAAELAALAAQSGPLEEELGAKRTQMSADGAHLAAFNLDKAGQQNQLIESQGRLSEVKSEIGRLEERIRSAESATADATARSAACETEKKGSSEKLQEIGPELERASAEAAEAEKLRAAAQAESDGFAAKVDALRASAAEAERALETLKLDSLSAAEMTLGLRRTLGDSESAWSRSETQVRGSLRELEKDFKAVATASGEIKAAAQALAAQEERSGECRARFAAAEASVSEKKSQLAALSDETLRLHAEVAQSEATLSVLETQGGQDAYWVGAQTVLNAAIPGVLGTVRQLFKVTDEAYKPYFEDALGERLYAIVCEDSTAARSAVELLESSGRGRARFLVLSSLPSQLTERAFPDEAKPLLRHIESEPKHSRALRFLLGESYTLGKTLFGDHWVYGGAPAREACQLSLADVDDVRAKTAAAKARTVELSGLKRQGEASLAEAEAVWRQAAAETGEQSARAAALKNQLGEKQAARSVFEGNAEVSTTEAARLLAEMALTKERINSLRREISSAEHAEAALRAREAEGLALVSGRKEERVKSEGAGELLKARLKGAEDKLNYLASAYERLAQDQKNLESAVERRGAEIAELARRQEESKTIASVSREKLDALQVQLAGMENLTKGILDKIAEIDKGLSEKEAVLRELKQHTDALTERLHQFELQASGQRGTQDQLKKQLWDEWQLSFEEAQGKYAGQEVDTERIDFLRKRIVSLGNVNMAAPEEYLALSERQVFLANQIEDLNKAKEDLKAAITKINSATRENFRQTFTEVREHFVRLFGVLFEGGEADLVMTEPDNILETGIDIVAQPPGKKLQSITLLSGGEKTLTAIALLFAFFLVKPSPFCMLDEADAALDDANVERFVALLREFQTKTQFLIVSHNKRTMEAADVIYGVTMEELGVSQLVSVDFRRKEKPVPAAEAAAKPETHGPFEMAASAPVQPPAEASQAETPPAPEPPAEKS